jgi:ribonuclease HII
MGVVIGVDEVGRGPLVGPATVAAVAVDEDWELQGVTDSKDLKSYRRVDLVPSILEQALHWVVAQSSSKQIDEYGVNTCVLHLMGVCVNRCLDRFPEALVIVDGLQFIPYVKPSVQRVIEKADKKFQSVGAASIIAKVFRDRQMIAFAADNMGYDLERNMGYGTRVLIRQTKKMGLTAWHRRSFEPVKSLIKEGKV